MIVDASPDLCPDCVKQLGLCASDHCRRQVLPQLKQSSLYRDAHSGKATLDAPPASESPEGRRVRERKARRSRSRLHRALLGEHTRAA